MLRSSSPVTPEGLAPQVDRRDFLILGSAAVAGLAATNAMADASGVAVSQPLPILSIGYCSPDASDVRSFVAANRLSGGDARFERAGAMLRFEGFWGPPVRRGEALSRGVNVFYPVGGVKTPFMAWSYAQTALGTLSSAPVSVTLPLDGKVIELGVHSRLPIGGHAPQAVIASHVQSTARLTTSAWGRRPRLRRGTYALALRSTGRQAEPDWRSIELTADRGPDGPLQIRTLTGREPVPFDYVLVSIDYATT